MNFNVFLDGSKENNNIYIALSTPASLDAAYQYFQKEYLPMSSDGREESA